MLNRQLKHKKKKVLTTDMQQQFNEQTLNFMQKMKHAVEQDHLSISEGKPALHRLLMLKEVDEMLRKKHIQIEFLH